MKYIVAGGREFKDEALMDAVLQTLLCDPYCEYGMPYDDVEIVSGMAQGADMMAVEWATVRFVKCHEMHADWSRYKLAAGHIRNAEMAEFSDSLIAFWDGESKGTKSMIDLALKGGLDVHVYRY